MGLPAFLRVYSEANHGTFGLTPAEIAPSNDVRYEDENPAGGDPADQDAYELDNPDEHVTRILVVDQG